MNGPGRVRVPAAAADKAEAVSRAAAAGPGGSQRGRRVSLLALGAALVVACGRGDPNALYSNTEREQHYGNLDKALQIARRAFESWESDRTSEWHWRFRLLLSDLVLESRPPAEALALLEAPVPSRMDRRLECWRQLFLYDAVSLTRGEPGARPYLEAAAALAGGDKTLTLEAGARRAQSETDPERAGALLAELLARAEAEGDQRRAAGLLSDLSHLHSRHGRFDEAMQYGERARRVAEAQGLRRLMSRALGSLGWCAYRLGEVDLALKYSSQADTLAEETADHRRRYRWVNNIGNLRFERGQYAAAAEQYRRAAALAERIQNAEWVTIALNNLTETWLRMGRADDAEETNRRALSMIPAGDAASLAFAQVRAARIAAARQRVPEAERLLRRVLAEPGRTDRQVDWLAWFTLAGLYAQTGRAREADEAFHAGFSAVDAAWSQLSSDQYRVSFLSQLAGNYQEYIDFLVSEGRPERALEVADSSRARVLAQRLDQRLPAAPSAAATALREKAGAAGAAGAAILFYSIGQERSHLWVITEAATRRFDLPGEKEIAAVVEKYGAAVVKAHDTLARDNPYAGRLYEMLVRPGESAMGAGGRVILVPDGPLHQINFETLIVTQPRPHYWIEDVTIQIAPSLNSLVRVHGGGGTPRLLLIGDPTPGDPGFPLLPHLAGEVDAISRHFTQRVVRTGEAASPEAYREAGPGEFSHIHFAAHAVPNRESPLNSAVILSPGNGGYKLYAQEILDTPLKARLVTLSACHAAGARAYSGEGLLGFSWAFLRAGARNVIASLWQVDDRVAGRLMTRLYSEMGRGRSPAEALRIAKLELLRSGGPFAAPYYWAPFELFTRELPRQVSAKKTGRVLTPAPSRGE